VPSFEVAYLIPIPHPATMWKVPAESIVAVVLEHEPVITTRALDHTVGIGGAGRTGGGSTTAGLPVSGDADGRAGPPGSTGTLDGSGAVTTGGWTIGAAVRPGAPAGSTTAGASPQAATMSATDVIRIAARGRLRRADISFGSLFQGRLVATCGLDAARTRL